jgi:hypothetical protein
MGDGVAFRVLEGRFALLKLPPDAQVPAAPAGAALWSATVTSEEISLICPEELVPKCPLLEIERSWRCIKVAGPLDFQLKGILTSFLTPLAEADVSVFALSTYFTDYILVKEYALPKAVSALVGAGHLERAS